MADEAKKPEFIRWLDKVGTFIIHEEPKLITVAQEAEPILAFTPWGPEYAIVTEAIVGIQKVAAASLAAGTTLTGDQKLKLVLASVTPALLSILKFKGVTENTEFHILTWTQNVFNILTGPAVQITKTIEQK